MDTLNKINLCNPCCLRENIRPLSINITGLMNFAIRKYRKTKKRIPSFILRDNPKNYNIREF